MYRYKVHLLALKDIRFKCNSTLFITYDNISLTISLKNVHEFQNVSNSINYLMVNRWKKWMPTCSADHILPLHYICVALVKLANALARQAAVVKFQDVPHLHRQRADLAASPLLCLHQAVAPPHVEPIQSGADWPFMEGKHQGGAVRMGLIWGGLLLG